MTTDVSVLKCLLCMLSLNLVILTPNTLYPYVHFVHNERSLEPKFRVGSGAGVATRPALFLGKNTRLWIPSRNLTLNQTWPIPWSTLTRAETVDAAVPRLINSGYRPGISKPFFADLNMSAVRSQLTYSSPIHGIDSRQVLEVPRVVSCLLYTSPSPRDV